MKECSICNEPLSEYDNMECYKCNRKIEEVKTHSKLLIQFNNVIPNIGFEENILSEDIALEITRNFVRENYLYRIKYDQGYIECHFKDGIVLKCTLKDYWYEVPMSVEYFNEKILPLLGGM